MEKTKRNLASKLVRRISEPYGALSACSIALMALGLWLCFGLLRPALAETEASRVFCVLVPHFKDEYWLSVGYGLEQEADRQNVELLFYEAGGYQARAHQIDQLGACAAQGVDGILIGAVTSDHPELLQAISRVARVTPVFGLVNELHAEDLSGRVGVDWRDMGLVLGSYLAGLPSAEGPPPRRAVLISGPQESGWIRPLENGLRAGLSRSDVEIVDVFGADTGLRQQLALVEAALARYPDIDYLIGSAPAVEAAIGLLQTRDQTQEPILVSTYISHTIKRGLMNGSVLATSFDDPTAQGAMAIRQAVDVISSGEAAGTIGPDVVLLTRTHSDLADAQLSPADYFPSIQ